MGNRGMGGVDGVISSALGASQVFDQTTVITGDVAFLHDINALSLQNEFRIRENHGTGKMPSVIIVLLNNCGAGGFQMLSQKPEEESFERLFLNPQSVDFKRLADGFGVTFRTVTSVNTFRRTYSSLLGEAGINIIEVLLPIAGMNERFAEYRRI
jgi:2-succinyl-5-enolpyruvyl-6-hydroxy-3-cyclohexene-1-carboxylate synthase